MANVDTIDITKLIMVEQGSTPSNPASGKQKLYVRSSDHVLCLVNSSGTVSAFGAPALTNPMTTKGDVILGDTGGTPSRLAASSTAHLVLASAGAGAFPVYEYPVLTCLTAALTGNVTMTTTGTYYDGPTVTLSAGTWLIHAFLDLEASSAGVTAMAAKLWDGTTVASGGEWALPGGGYGRVTAYLSGQAVVASGTPVWKMSARAVSGTGSDLIRASTATTTATNVASQIFALRIA